MSAVTETAPPAIHPLTLQLLEWVAHEPRTYAEVLEVWRTSCPRLSVWEDACLAGLVQCESGTQGVVRPSAKGWAVLGANKQ